MDQYCAVSGRLLGRGTLPIGNLILDRPCGRSGSEGSTRLWVSLGTGGAWAEVGHNAYLFIFQRPGQTRWRVTSRGELLVSDVEEIDSSLQRLGEELRHRLGIYAWEVHPDGGRVWLEVDWYRQSDPPESGSGRAALDPDELFDLLGRVHEKGVTHGGIWPGCFRRDAAGKATIGEFFLPQMISRLRERVDAGRALGTSVGHPWFMAPEVVLGDPPAAASDLYALAASLAWLMSRELREKGANWPVAGESAVGHRCALGPFDWVPEFFKADSGHVTEGQVGRLRGCLDPCPSRRAWFPPASRAGTAPPTTRAGEGAPVPLLPASAMQPPVPNRDGGLSSQEANANQLVKWLPRFVGAPGIILVALILGLVVVRALPQDRNPGTDDAGAFVAEPSPPIPPPTTVLQPREEPPPDVAQPVDVGRPPAPPPVCTPVARSGETFRFRDGVVVLNAGQRSLVIGVLASCQREGRDGWHAQLTYPADYEREPQRRAEVERQRVDVTSLLGSEPHRRPLEVVFSSVAHPTFTVQCCAR